MKRTYVGRNTDRSALWRAGPVVAALLTPGAVDLGELQKRGGGENKTQRRLLIDTGADHSMIYQSVATSLSLRPIRTEKVGGINVEPITCFVYAAAILMPVDEERGGHTMLRVPLSFRSLPDKADPRRIDGLLGRDFLRDFDMAYRGPAGMFTLETTVDWDERDPVADCSLRDGTLDI